MVFFNNSLSGSLVDLDTRACPLQILVVEHIEILTATVGTGMPLASATTFSKGEIDI